MAIYEKGNVGTWFYEALKTSSDFQYMSVEAYDEGKDTWKHTKAEGMWVKPDGAK